VLRFVGEARRGEKRREEKRREERGNLFVFQLCRALSHFRKSFDAFGKLLMLSESFRHFRKAFYAFGKLSTLRMVLQKHK
jgi:hypothetical protein